MMTMFVDGIRGSLVVVDIITRNQHRTLNHVQIDVGDFGTATVDGACFSFYEWEIQYIVHERGRPADHPE
jgi:hypothetical protein